VSKTTKRHCTGTVQSQGGRVGNLKQMGFELGPEDSYRRCGTDNIKQTVPDANIGDQKSSVTNGEQSCKIWFKVAVSIYAAFTVQRTLLMP